MAYIGQNEYLGFNASEKVVDDSVFYQTEWKATTKLKLKSSLRPWFL